MEEHKKYTASDFARYHSGAMSPDEMYALEKAALADPFLADALEGYAYSMDPEKEVDEIKSRLTVEKKQHTISKWSAVSNSMWWKIAAMLIIITGAGYLFLFIDPPKDASLAIKESATKNELQETISPKKEDSIFTNDIVAFEKPTIDKNKSHSINTPQSSEKSVAIAPVKESVSDNKLKSKTENIPPDEIPPGQKEMASARNDKRTLSPDAIALDTGEGRFSFSSDTIALVAATPQISETIVGNGALKDRKAPFSDEVVALGYGKQKNNRKTLPKRSAEKVSGIAVITPPPFPKGGKEKFEEFIKENAQPVLDSLGKKISANILLSFSLNKKGNPVHIKILESSCKACESEAIRLLKEGPEWVGAKGAKGKVRIRFNSPPADNIPALHP